ncbi:MAG TPA: alpha/beta fold hydrolase [Trebonia sp.]|jgi:pimeloyl-ACP methyl ester carboxylesterase|nr:alpha/beta fold hydrolase [Trebonia sp.]
MTTFVLVHGAWGGSYAFRTVRGPLRAAGHEVFTPSLTGLGERAHLSSPQVGLATHVTDVANTILYEDLSDIVLLGYSYGGMVVTGALEHVADRVAHLVYLDAFVPADGEALNDLTGAHAGFTTVGPDAQWLVPPAVRAFDEGVDAAWHLARRVPHPARCFSEPVRLRKPLEDHRCTRTYIKATAEPRPSPNRPSAFWATADRVRRDPAWRYREIDTNHMILANRPGELVDLLLPLVLDGFRSPESRQITRTETRLPRPERTQTTSHIQMALEKPPLFTRRRKTTRALGSFRRGLTSQEVIDDVRDM